MTRRQHARIPPRPISEGLAEMQALFVYVGDLTSGSSRQRVAARFLRVNGDFCRELQKLAAHVSKFGTFCVCSFIPCDLLGVFAPSMRLYTSARMVRHTLSTTKLRALERVIHD